MADRGHHAPLERHGEYRSPKLERRGAIYELFYVMEINTMVTKEMTSFLLPAVTLQSFASQYRMHPALNALTSVIRDIRTANCVLCGRPTPRQLFVPTICDLCKSRREAVLIWSPHLLCENDSVRR